jgi:hypothetical protein
MVLSPTQCANAPCLVSAVPALVASLSRSPGPLHHSLCAMFEPVSCLLPLFLGRSSAPGGGCIWCPIPCNEHAVMLAHTVSELLEYRLSSARQRWSAFAATWWLCRLSCARECSTRPVGCFSAATCASAAAVCCPMAPQAAAALQSHWTFCCLTLWR